MALRPYPGFVGPSYTSESKIAAYDRTVNWYPERIESGTGPAQYVLYPTPGFLQTITASDSPGRGGLAITGQATSDTSIIGERFFVAGTTLFRYAVSPEVLATGIVNGSDAVVQMVTNGENGHQLLFASDSTIYCFDTDSLTLTNEGTGHAVAFLNSYGIRVNRSTNSFDFSAPFDFTSWDPIDTVVREDAADNWVTVLAFREELWLFGAATTSIYYNDSTDEDFPWKPNESAFIQMGILAPDSACIVGGAPMWLGQDDAGDGVVYRANGYTPVRVSTHAVEFAIQSLPEDTRGRAEACTYQQNGHVFYELTLPTQPAEGSANGQTWVYDVTEGLWHERGERNALEFTNMDTRGYFGAVSLSRTSGKVYNVITNIDSSFANIGTNGDPIVRLRRCPHINVSQRRIRYHRFRLLTQPGNGLGNVPSTTVGYDPQITLSWSNNGGQTFGSGYPASIGKIGEFDKLVEWFQLEQASDRVFELTWSAPVFRPLIDAFLDYSIGPS